MDSRGIALPGTSKARFIKSNCESQGKELFFIYTRFHLLLTCIYCKDRDLLHFFFYFFSGWRLSTCQRHFQQASRFSSLYLPKCRQDGRYKDVQCYGRTCFCVGRNGLDLGLNRTVLPRFPTCPPRPGKKICAIRIRPLVGF